MEEKFLQILYPVNQETLSYDDFVKKFVTGKGALGYNDFKENTAT